ncbi:protein FANTASTIC FOUR 3 [Iris pallida]|uniref:Protein FANTASTIC FOUR 3 n=1 Tax=Iris pallida TaxID=29817 RepID=A0AAX6HZ26_IRIPA|nr:protein FANTASTIC FOUR 3 [Iris pallida]
MAPISAVSIPQQFMPCLEPEQDHPVKLKLHQARPLLDSLVNRCDKDHEEVVAPSQWSVLFSLPSQPRTILEAIDASQSTVRTAPPPPPPLTSAFVKRQLLKMQNLELCTEILGSENGVLYPVDDEPRPEELWVRSRRRRRRREAASEFPPPLTILGGEDRLRLSTKRENGRLLLVPFVPSLLEVERSEGCLRLRLLPSKSSSPPLLHPKEEASDNEGSGEDGEYLGVVGMERKSLVFGSNGEYRRIGRCKEEEEDVRPMAGGVGSRRNKVMLISDAVWISSS